ncbi:MAG: 3-phosphoshikimate 1-carboxyvinyltransferase [Deltaproteobacteria bacterium]|nr:MAG: 3-phosphoshikimate 1-carboxyvinyltransferase [Deltaproteobacteria bacterium]
MSTWTVHGRGPLRGELTVPGDKSISHRSLLFNALASGPARVRGLLEGEDVHSTASALSALGTEIERDGDAVVVRPRPLAEPADVIDCGNSGTTIRLLTGILARQPFLSVLTGDGSLRKRPMRRVIDPLTAMGARIDGRDGGRLPPLVIRGGALTPGHRFDLSISSAQVKSCLLLAGMTGGVWVREPRQSRDHSERMLRAMGADLIDEDGGLRLAPTAVLEPLDVDVPGDISSAAFWLVGGAVVPGSDITLRQVGLNPTRTGVVDALRAMGAQLEVEPVDAAGAEPIGNVRVRAGGLRGTRIDGELALRCLDELPVLAVAAAFAEGETTIADAGELRVKESDRIARVVQGLRAMHVQVEEHPDGMTIVGGHPHGPARVDATGDHRIAMAFAIAALAGEGPVELTGAEAIGTSYPQFAAHLEALTRE